MSLIFTRRDWYGTAEHLDDVWRLVKNGRQARAAVVTHPLGVELRIEVAGELRESLVARYDDEPVMEKADAWKVALVEDGCT